MLFANTNSPDSNLDLLSSPDPKSSTVTTDVLATKSVTILFQIFPPELSLKYSALSFPSPPTPTLDAPAPIQVMFDNNGTAYG